MPFLQSKPGLPIARFLWKDRPDTCVGLCAPARADARTKRLAQRIRPGEIAIINHSDLDGPAAEALVARQVAAVVNIAPSISGHYPNRGPEVLQAAGIPLIDSCDINLIELVEDGELLELREGGIYRGVMRLAQGLEMTPERWQHEIAGARTNLDAALREFVSNTLSYVEQEKGLLFEAALLPELCADVRDRHVLVVVRGEGARQDLATIRSYIRDRKPVLIGVDGGADLLREIGFTPQIIFGDMDSISDDCLRCGAQLIVHAYPNGRCPGRARLDALGLNYEILPGRGTSEDVILLAAYEKGADLITAVGTHFNLIDFLDKARSGMSSTFLVRLRIGSRLVDAKGVNRLYVAPYPLVYFSAMILMALAAGVTILLVSREAQSFLQLFWLQVQRLLHL